MDHERNEMDKMDEVMLPGFRFHPTDEELVGFYLKRKIQQRPLSIELIKQLDIYKYNPWDLPKLATTGEKEWYFYCPRDRKYRNSARPNRVTGAGFWKATGTDRPIYSSEGNKCIGLKKSLVFYKGRAAKGIKTDWMMHEFRLPSLTDSSHPPKRFLDKTNIPASDSWAICRIFKKTNSTAQRALSQSWVSPLPEPTSSDHHILAKGSQTSGFIPHDISLITETSSAIQLNYNNNGHVQHPSTTTATTNFSSQPLDFPYYRPLNSLMLSKPTSHHQVPPTYGTLMFSPLETLAPTKCTSSVVDVSSILLNMSSSMLGDFGKTSNDCIDFGASQQDHCNGLSFCSINNFQQTMQGMSVVTHEDQNVSLKNINMSDTDDHHWPETVRNSNIGLAFNLSANMVGSDAWRPNLIWESSSSPSDVSSTSFSTTKCYT